MSTSLEIFHEHVAIDGDGKFEWVTIVHHLRRLTRIFGWQQRTHTGCNEIKYNICNYETANWKSIIGASRESHK